MPSDHWQDRFTASRPGFPYGAADAPDRSLYTCNTSGACEIHVWDRAADVHRQVTRRAAGTSLGALSADGRRVWWFDDTDGDEVGRWMTQPFEAGPGEGGGEGSGEGSGEGTGRGTPVRGVPEGFPAGLALGAELTLIAVATDEGTGLWSLPSGGSEDGTATLLRAFEDDVDLLAVSADERLAVLARDTGLEVISTADGKTVTVLADPAGGALDAFGFSPVPGDRRLVVRRETPEGVLLGVQDLDRGTRTPVPLPPGEPAAEWYPDGKALLVTVHHQGRSTLHRHDLVTGQSTALPVPAGTIDAAGVRADGRVEYVWSSSALPPVVRVLDADGSDRVLFRPPGSVPPGGPELEDAWVPTPAGPLHLLTARAAGAPRGTVFLLHGGPHAADSDRYSAYRAVWTDAGVTVVHVNYRGSTGYGTAWRDANHGRPGFPELEDLNTAYEWAVGAGLAVPGRCLVAGSSWGGFLTLLALGLQPHRWAAGIAESPIADHAAAYEQRPEFLQAFDRELFGGSPEELPEVYTASSPLTYVDRVRAPVLVLHGHNDPRCPPGQIDRYLERLRERGVRHERYGYDAGHGTLVGAELIRQAAVQMRFVDGVLD
ncbi:prolyl oligopeptidase family serine peptidase [Streptomyces sp. NBC_00454]|uniref:S9 family peptidase n=1 Tax=Streptomyces sp. NBC_00454 TaxID=2975747 RepID=UPI0030E54BE5